jgi:glycosyltransferase involved in cell wall biosynthesis
LIELLRAGDAAGSGFCEVHLWGGRTTLDQIEERPWLTKHHQPLLDRSLPVRAFWQRFKLSQLARSSRCDLVLVPGGSYAGDFHPVVAMSRNMLPFEWSELRRYGWSLMSLRLLVLRWVQSRTFRRADGVIFLTRYARNAVMQVIGTTSGTTAIIPHGVDGGLLRASREQKGIERYSADNPFKIIYVSIVDQYKHQCEVAEAIALLRDSGLPVTLDLVGPAYPPSLEQLRQTLARVDPHEEFVFYRGALPYSDLADIYAQSDLCVFASTCENMPNILLEGMAAGLPIACSSRGPMPEILGDAGVYFDPENPLDVARALTELVSNRALRARSATGSSARVRDFSWDRCARETFEFLADVAARSGRIPASMDGS